MSVSSAWFHVKFFLCSVAPSDSVTPLNLSSNDMRRLNRLAKATQAPSQGPALNKPPSVPSDLSRQVSSTKSEPTLHRQGSLMSHLGSSMRRKMSSASHVIAREEAKTAKVYTVSLLLLLVTWTPFYISHMIQIITTDDNFTIHLSPIIKIAATIYAPLSAILHGYRNTKVRRELCQMFSLQCEDVATPLPSRRGKVFRSLSMRESTRIRNRDVRRDRLLRHSFMGDINNHKQNNEKENTIIKNKLPSDCIESQTLLLSLTSSSAESSARSSFSTGPSHPRYVTLLANHRQEVTCWKCFYNSTYYQLIELWFLLVLKECWNMNIAKIFIEFESVSNKNVPSKKKVQDAWLKLE